MSKAKENDPEKEPQASQQFDTTFKDWLRQSAPDIVPLVLPGATYIDMLDVEIIRPTMRADKVVKALVQNELHIINFEFESGADSKMASRLHVYNAVLHYDYQLPVMSIIIYPFRTTIAKSPLHIKTAWGEIIKFNFLTWPLFEERAGRFVHEHIYCMYPLLPTMQGTDTAMMKRVMAELADLYQDDEVKLSQQYVWMQLFLDRTTTISPSEKVEIRKELSMYDRLWEEDPRVQQDRAEAKTEGKAEGLQSAVVTVVKVRFPTLADLAEEKTSQIHNPDILKFLLAQISAENDEAVVRALLRPTAA